MNEQKPLNAAMDNVLAWRMGEACNAAAKDSAGDLIDRGLSLLHHLKAKGFDVVASAAAPVKPEAVPAAEEVKRLADIYQQCDTLPRRAALHDAIDRLAALSTQEAVPPSTLGAPPSGSGSPLQPPAAASAAIPSAEHAQLMRFYAVDTLPALIDAQARHIEKLQAKLPPTPSLASQRAREG